MPRRSALTAAARLVSLAAAVLAFGTSALAQDAPAGAPAPSAPFSAAPGWTAAEPGIDVLHYDIALDLPDSGRRIQGRVTLAVRRTARVDTLRLDLVGLGVDSVLVGGAPVRFARDSLSIGVPLPPGAGDTLAVTVRYGGEPADGLIIRSDSSWGWTAFGDNWPQRARYWIPSVDEPGDKATVSWSVRAPSALTVVANGELEEVTPLPRATGGAARTLTRWRESRPVPTYVMAIAAARLAYVDLGRSACGRAALGGCVRQSAYVAPAQRGVLPGPFARVGEIVSFFATIVAPFPYEHLAHLQSSTRFGGMENATEIFYADRSVRDRKLDEGTVAHETAHQWFGDAVTPARFADLWLSEGFATYWSQLWTRHAEGDSAFRAGMARLRRQVIAAPVVAARPVRDTAQTSYLALLDANSYQKGAWVLHMLRVQLGDSAFFRGIRGYYLAHRDGNARTEELRAALERAAGRPLGWFFHQWLTRPGYPVLATRWRYDGARHRVTLYVDQAPRFGSYRFPLTIELRDAHGVARRVTVQVAARASQRIVLPLRLDAAPRAITLDPDVDLLASFAGAR